MFWINALEKAGREEEAKQSFQRPRNTIKPDTCWRRRLFPAATPNFNRFSALSEGQSVEARKCPVMAVERGREELEGKIIIDSGAADSVVRKEVLEDAFPLMPKKEGLRFVAANGAVINNYGRRSVAFKARGQSLVNRMQFHVTDSKKTLASVSKIVEQGNSVHFTPTSSYIEGPKGERVTLSLEGGVYVIDAKFMKGFSRQA